MKFKNFKNFEEFKIDFKLANSEFPDDEKLIEFMHRMYLLITELMESFITMRYNKVNNEHMFELMNNYFIYISWISRLSKEQLTYFKNSAKIEEAKYFKEFLNVKYILKEAASMEKFDIQLNVFEQIK